MKNKIILFTHKQELVNNLCNSEVVHFDYEVVDEVGKLFEYDSTRACMILFDLDSFKQDFIEFFSYLKTDFPRVRLMAIASSPDIFKGVQYLKEGVKGYGNSFMHPVHLQQAVDVICEENKWIYPELASYMIQQTPVSNSRVEMLKDMDSREKEIINFVCKGMKNRDIAHRLSLSEISVKKILTHIYQKVHVKDRLEMITLLNRES